MPRFTGGAVGALAYDAISTFEPSVPLPDRDPVGVPLASFIETDLVIVFDHLTHQLSAIASLHTEAPDLDGRYRIAERAIFEALERTARPRRPRSPAASSRPADARRHRARLGQVETSLGRDEYIRAVEQRQGRDRRRRGDPGRPRPAPVVRPAGDRRRRRRSTASASTARSGGSTPARTCSSPGRPAFEVVGASPELLLQVAGDRMSTHPIAGTRPRGTTPADDDRLADELRNDPKERAEHVMLVDLGRNDLGRVAKPGTVSTSQYMEVERYSHVLHLVSHVEAPPRAGAGRARRAPLRVPRRHPDRRPEDPRDAAHRRGRGRAARAVWWRRGLPRLRRQPRHRDHDPERRPQGRPGARPHRRRDRRPERARARVRGDRAQGRRAAPGDRARRRAGRAAPPTLRRRPASRSRRRAPR